MISRHLWISLSKKEAYDTQVQSCRLVYKIPTSCIVITTVVNFLRYHINGIVFRVRLRVYKPCPNCRDNLALRSIFFDVNFSIELLLPNRRFVVPIHDFKHHIHVGVEDWVTPIGGSDCDLEAGSLQFQGMAARTRVIEWYFLHRTFSHLLLKIYILKRGRW